MVPMHRFAADEVTVDRAVHVETVIACALAFVASAVLFIGMFEGARSPEAVVVCAAGLLVLLLGMTLRRRPRWYEGPVGIELTSDSLVACGRTVRARYALAEVREGWVEGDSPCVVRLRMYGGDVVSARLPHVEEGEAVLRAVHVSAEERPLHVPLECAAARSPGGLSLVVATLMLLGGMLPFALPFFLESLFRSPGSATGVLFSTAVSCGGLTLLVVDLFGLYKCVQLLSSPNVTIGTDGIAIRGIGRDEFIPYADVIDLREGDGEIEVRLRNGESVPLAIAVPTKEDPATAVASVLRRLRQARTAGPRGFATSRAALAPLARGNRSVKQWVEDLERLARGEEAGYRDLPFGRRELLALAEDADAPPELRVVSVAAIATSGRMTPEVLERVKAAVETSANEPLRLAMERALYGYVDEFSLAATQAHSSFFGPSL